MSEKLRDAEAARVSGGASRRDFLKGVGLAAGATALLPALAEGQGAAPLPATPGLEELGAGARSITLKVNGVARQVTVEPRTTLLDALRIKLALTGSKEICDRGACGGCTVLLDGEAINSCLALAIDAVGSEITTIEGVSADPRYATLIESFCEHDAAQCGYCIPGFVVRSAAMLKATPSPTDAQIREGLTGNICRCGAYSMIFDAVKACAAKGGVGA
jgi:aerobic-type carbon monoxide dehydrogenase small subunit (CoxS/CutS family)